MLASLARRLCRGGPFLFQAEALMNNHHHSRDLKCNACGRALPSH
jgi:hypothetical protein